MLAPPGFRHFAVLLGPFPAASHVFICQDWFAPQLVEPDVSLVERIPQNAEANLWGEPRLYHLQGHQVPHVRFLHHGMGKLHKLVLILLGQARFAANASRCILLVRVFTQLIPDR